MSGEYLARLKAERPDVDWDAEMAAARRRREKLERSLWQRFRHWIHAQAYPDLHREKCSKCRPSGPFGPLPDSAYPPGAVPLDCSGIPPAQPAA